MTANNTNTTESENSVLPSFEGSGYASVNDPHYERIAQLASEAGWILRRDLHHETELSQRTLDDYLDQLATENFVELIGESGRQVVVLTKRGQWLAWRSDG